MRTLSGFILLVFLALTACTASEESTSPPTETKAEAAAPAAVVAKNPLRNAYFGDTHVHTRYSFDAYLVGTRGTPDDAYRFAKGDAIEHASGFQMQLKKPLDFLAVTDHAFYLGALAEAAEGSGPSSELEIGKIARNISKPADSGRGFMAVAVHSAAAMKNPVQVDTMNDPAVFRSAWQDTIDAAERHNRQGEFTAFVGYEFTTSGPNNEGLHRNVIFRSAKVPDVPFSRLNSMNPEDLWRWMDKQREAGIESLAIPHNSNVSSGLMFQTTRFDGSPQDTAYAKLRMRNEPVVENTQIKGTSDTHPLLSPNDEWASFEIMPILPGSKKLSEPEGSYVRHAYGRGLQTQENRGFNPYKFGVIGSSDTHNAAGSFEEDNFWSKLGIIDIDPKQRASIPFDESTDAGLVKQNPMMMDAAPTVAPDGRTYASASAQYFGASGLAGVWAQSNTREDLYDAIRSKEVFSTSGPRIKVRFFGSANFEASLLNTVDAIELAYSSGVPMGGELSFSAAAPKFLVWAAGDPDSVGLQRLQLIKGWLAEGVMNEKVYDIACSDGGTVDANTHRCPDNGARVDLSTCAVTPDKGAAELKSLWQDPDFEVDQRAFYYVRVLENPKCRWSTWDAIRAGVAPRVDMKTIIQDRAWSSPIWYNPRWGTDKLSSASN